MFDLRLCKGVCICVRMIAWCSHSSYVFTPIIFHKPVCNFFSNCSSKSTVNYLFSKLSNNWSSLYFWGESSSALFLLLLPEPITKVILSFPHLSAWICCFLGSLGSLCWALSSLNLENTVFWSGKCSCIIFLILLLYTSYRCLLILLSTKCGQLYLFFKFLLLYF